MPSQHRTPVRTLLLPIGGATAAAGALLIAGLVASPPTAPGARAAATGQFQPEPHDLDRELRRCGLSPEALACAGLTAADAAALVERAQSHLDADGHTALANAIESHTTAASHRDRLERLFRAGTPGGYTQDDLHAARADADATRAAMDEKITDLFDAACHSLDAGVVAKIASINAQKDIAYPDYYKVVQRTHAQAVALRNARNAVRIDTELGLEPKAHDQAVINAELARPEIAAAKLAYETNLDTITLAWQNAIEGE